MRFSPNAVVAKSGQDWKIHVFFAASMIGGVLMLCGLRIHTNAGFLVCMLSGVLLELGSLAAVCLAVRCPRCGARWFWMAVSSQKSDQWLKWLYAQSECPKCGYDAGAPVVDGESSDACSGDD
jgi:hypothetical protein